MLVSNTVAELSVAGSSFSDLPGNNSKEHYPRSSNTHPRDLYGLMSRLDRQVFWINSI